MSRRGQVVLITGATGALGRALVSAFAQAGADVVGAARRLPALQQIEDEERQAGRSVWCQPCDVRFEEDAVRLVHRVVQRFGRIDVAINAATAFGPRCRLVDHSTDPWRHVLAVNVTGTFLICREVMPWMARQGGGCIVNVTSDVVRPARPNFGAYLVSRAAVEGLSELLAAECADSGVRVNVVDVGIPGTAVSGDSLSAVAEAFLWLAGPDAAAVTGKRFTAADLAQPRGSIG